jgi:hypothetical protein
MEVYNQDSNQNFNQKSRLSVGEWVLTIFLVGIPIVGLIMLCIWAFGNKNDERENFAKASLIWMLIGILLTIAFISCVGGLAFLAAF